MIKFQFNIFRKTYILLQIVFFKQNMYRNNMINNMFTGNSNNKYEL